MLSRSLDAYGYLGEYIVSCQEKNGAIAWEPSSKIDPWDHVESAMGLDVLGFEDSSKKAYEWLIDSQESDGSWFSEYKKGKVTNFRKETNFAAYIATGAWHHYLNFENKKFLQDLWPSIEKAMNFVLEGQTRDGDVLWAKDKSNEWMDDSLLTGCSSIYKSLVCAQNISNELGLKKEAYKEEISKISEAIKNKPERFDRSWESKSRYSMDWYYPVLCGVIVGEAAQIRINEGWNKFVVEDLGCKCVEEEPWVTTAESCELVLALNKILEKEKAETVFNNVLNLVDPKSNLFWTGYVFKDKKYWPIEKPSWTAAAVILAANSLYKLTKASDFF